MRVENQNNSAAKNQEEISRKNNENDLFTFKSDQSQLLVDEYQDIFEQEMDRNYLLNRKKGSDDQASDEDLDQFDSYEEISIMLANTKSNSGDHEHKDDSNFQSLVDQIKKSIKSSNLDKTLSNQEDLQIVLDVSQGAFEGGELKVTIVDKTFKIELENFDKNKDSIYNSLKPEFLSHLQKEFPEYTFIL